MDGFFAPLFCPRFFPRGAAAFVSLLFWCCAFSGSAFFGHKPYDARLAAFMKAAEGRAVRPGLRAARAWRHAASNANP